MAQNNKTPMSLVSFDAMRSFGIPNTTYVKAELTQRHMDVIRRADWLLFPEYWQVNALYYGLKKPIFPSISTYHVGHDKIEMTRTVQLLWPRHMPETLIFANSADAREKILAHFDFPFVAKSVRSSMGIGVWLIRNQAEWEHYADHHTALYVQEYLPLERDLRIVVIGRKVATGYWRCRSTDPFRTNVAQGGRIDRENIPEAAVKLVEKMACHLDIDYAGFDMAQIGQQLFFFEFNRLFGTAGLIKQGIAVGTLIYQYLESKQMPPLIPPVSEPRRSTG